MNHPYAIVRGNFAEGNFGDDALLLAAHNLLMRHYPADRIRYECPALAYRQDEACEARTASRLDIFRANAIIYGGGTQFFSFPNSGHGNGKRSLLRQTASIMRRVPASLYIKARAWRENVIASAGIGLGFGPFVPNSPATQAAGKLAAAMSFLWVRDAASLAFCASCGAGGAFQSSDLCFLPSFQNLHVATRSQPSPATMPRVGFVLRDWHYSGKDGLPVAPYVQAAAECRKKGLQVQFFIFSPKRDQQTLRELAAAGENVICWNPQSMRITDYVTMLDSCDLLVTQRFHAAIFSLLLGKPFMAVGIEPKLDMVADMYGIADAKAPTGNGKDELTAKIFRMLANSDACRKKARQVLAEQTTQASRAQAAFDGFMQELQGG